MDFFHQNNCRLLGIFPNYEKYKHISLFDNMDNIFLDYSWINVLKLFILSRKIWLQFWQTWIKQLAYLPQPDSAEWG